MLGGSCSYSLNSLKGVIWGTTIGVIQGDTGVSVGFQEARTCYLA